MINLNKVNSRAHAAALHLAASVLVAMTTIAIVFYLWYPGHFASATGVTEIFLIIMAVDICLGPLLTFVVFNPKKPELKFDLLIIFLIQIAALTYGVYTVAKVRPTFLVFVVDRFETVHANDLDATKLSAAKFPAFRSISYTGPSWAAAELPSDREERNDLVFNSSLGGDDIAQTPKYYIPYSDAQSKVKEKLQPVTNLFDKNPNKKSEIDSLISKYKDASMEIAYLPLTCKKRDLSVLIDSNNAEILEVVDLNPW
jgi:hypothetical protein